MSRRRPIGDHERRGGRERGTDLGDDVAGRLVRSCQVNRSRSQRARTSAFPLCRSALNRSTSMCHAQPSISTASIASGKAMSMRYLPKGCPRTQPVMPAARRSATARARLPSRPGPPRRRAGRRRVRSRARRGCGSRRGTHAGTTTWRCSARSRKTEPSGTTAAVSSAVSGLSVSQRPREFDQVGRSRAHGAAGERPAVGAGTRHGARSPRRCRGTDGHMPCHQAAAGPGHGARSPTHSPAARTRAASLRGCPPTRNTRGSTRSQSPASDPALNGARGDTERRRPGRA